MSTKGNAMSSGGLQFLCMCVDEFWLATMSEKDFRSKAMLLSLFLKQYFALHQKHLLNTHQCLASKVSIVWLHLVLRQLAHIVNLTFAVGSCIFAGCSMKSKLSTWVVGCVEIQVGTKVPANTSINCNLWLRRLATAGVMAGGEVGVAGETRLVVMILWITIINEVMAIKLTTGLVVSGGRLPACRLHSDREKANFVMVRAEFPFLSAECSFSERKILGDHLTMRHSVLFVGGWQEYRLCSNWW